MQKTDSALWIGSGSIFLTGIVYLLLRDSTSDLLRVVLTLLALLAPLGIAAAMGEKDYTAWLGDAPEPLVLVLSGAAGLAVWAVCWWLMFIVNQELMESVGEYVPGFFVMDSWFVEVVYTVVLLPAAVTLPVFGVMRHHLTGVRTALPILALYTGVLYMLTTPQGLAGLLGYGIMGLLAAFLAHRARSMWTAFAVAAVFMYANRAFLDNLIREFGDAYFQTSWLTLALAGAFVVLVCTQVIRFRTEAQSPPPPRPITRMGWAALGAALLVVILYAASEINQRNEAATAWNAFPNTSVVASRVD